MSKHAEPWITVAGIIGLPLTASTITNIDRHPLLDLALISVGLGTVVAITLWATGCFWEVTRGDR